MGNAARRKPMITMDDVCTGLFFSVQCFGCAESFDVYFYPRYGTDWNEEVIKFCQTQIELMYNSGWRKEFLVGQDAIFCPDCTKKRRLGE